MVDQSRAKPVEDRASRRRFIQGGTTALAGSTLIQSMSKPVHAAHDDTLKVALVGCGGRGTGAAAQALSTPGPVKLWSMADAFDDRLQGSLENLRVGVSARYDRGATAGLADRIEVPRERQFVGLDAYQQAIDSDVDVVILTGPPGFRPQHFEYAVAAGKHVFMEKPLATDAPGVRRVLAAAANAKVKNLKVGVGLQRHHQASYRQALERIHRGELGHIDSLRCYWNSGPPAKSAIPRDQLTELQYQVRNWYFFTWLSGDHICEQHIHNLDVGNWIMGDHPVLAEGMGGRQVRTGKEYGNIFDHHAVEYTYADGTKMYSQCRQMPGCKNQVAEYAHGAKADAVLSPNRCSIQAGDKRLWRYRPPRDKTATNPYQVEHDVLFDAIRNGLEHNEAAAGAISTMTAIMGRMATYSGRAVGWEAALQSELCLTIDTHHWDDQPPVQVGQDGYYPAAVPGKTVAV